MDRWNLKATRKQGFIRQVSITASLAWSQLVFEKRRLLAAIAGICFAVVLMLMQLGIRDALFKSCTLHYSHFNADLVMIGQQHESLLATKAFPRRRLWQTLAFQGVESVLPVYASLGTWKNPQTLKQRSILVMGFEPSSCVFNVAGIESNLKKLDLPDVVLFDAASRPEFGAIKEAYRAGVPVRTELMDHRVEVGGLFTLGTSFGIDGTVVCNSWTFLRIFPSRRPGVINFGLIQLKPGADAGEVLSRINKTLPSDVRVLSRAELVQKEQAYWAQNTPIGFVITMTMIIGLVVGSVILYQILYTDINEHLKEFATLKAIGYTNAELSLVVLVQAFMLAMLAYPLAWAVSAVLYGLTHQATLLPIAMTAGRTLQIFLLTALMCSVSGLLAMQRLRAADPAEVF